MISYLKNWKSGNSKNVNQEILFAAVLFGIMTFLAKIVSMAKELMVAGRFGTSDVLDAFYTAFLVPSFIVNVLVGSLSSSLIPVYIDVRDKEGREGSRKLLSNVAALVFLLLATVSIITLALGRHILSFLGAGFSKEKLVLTNSLFLILLPLIFLNGFSIFFGYIINAEKKFALAAVTPAITSIIVVIFLIYPSIFALATGIIVGAFLELCIMGWALFREKIFPVPMWHGKDPYTEKTVVQYFFTVLALLLMNMALIADQMTASVLPSGSVSSLNYGCKLGNLILTMGAGAIGTVALPYFSDMASARDWKGIRNTMGYYGRIIFYTTIPTTILMIIFSRHIIYFIFERGAFSASDTLTVSKIQSFYLIQIYFYIMVTLFMKFASAIKRNNIILLWAAISLFFKILLNRLLVKFWGVAGISMATSIIFIFGILFWYVVYYRLLCEVETA